MKNKILIIFISFIFLSIFSINVLASTNENIENNVFETKEKDEVEMVQNSINYAGTMHIDAPSNNATFVKPDDTSINIIGWAVSNDSSAIVRILLDGNVVGKADRIKREDVDIAISPQYGGTALTPEAGFNYILNVSNLLAGNHQITIQQLSKAGNIIYSQNTQINIKNKQYKGELYLDTPSYNEVFARPNSVSIGVIGWAVSNDSGAMIRVILDGKIVGNGSRVKREDVDATMLSLYGGIVMTPKAGFNYILDVSYLDAGNHQITVQEVSRYGDVICSLDRQIKIQNKQYAGTMYVDTPNCNEVFIKPDSSVGIIGWAVSNDSNATIRVLLDGNMIGNGSRVKREDVDSEISPYYGGVATTQKAGFNYFFDGNHLLAGNHQITIQEISRYGDVICSAAISIVIQNKQYKGEMYLDAPQNGVTLVKQEVSYIEIGGWAVSEDKEATVRILLDGNVVVNQCNRRQRSDVDNSVALQYGGYLWTPYAGFYYTMNVSNLAIGTHILRIEQISKWGDLICGSEAQINIINKQYLGEMCLDYPKNGTVEKIGENLIVDGWAVAQDEAASVEIYVDGVFKETAQRYYRPDVVYYMNKYDGKTVNAGFGKLINTSGMSIGTHTITVYEKSRYGDIIGGVGATFVVKSNQVVNNSSSSNNNSNNSNNSSSAVHNTTNVSGTKGIDVSQFQGAINWTSVAGSGIKYAMIRIGYRGYGGGGLAEDSKFKKNFAEAVASGLKVGVYFYSAAINATEAKKDAEYVRSILQKYGYQNKVSMPIAMDLELIPGVATRDRNVSKATRTNIANTFCQTIANYGYTPMIYANKSFLNSNLNSSQIPYDIWVAQYNSKCTYSGSYTMWQYSSSGRISGISGNVDCNICYKNY